jgi:hypothetical protein
MVACAVLAAACTFAVIGEWVRDLEPGGVSSVGVH